MLLVQAEARRAKLHSSLPGQPSVMFAAQATASPADVNELVNINDNEVVLLTYTVNYCDLMNMFILLLCVCKHLFGCKKNSLLPLWFSLAKTPQERR